jgi:ABC-type bacteriocin/lantibiotic exporter with double-glycine peptidase domain
VVVRWCGSPRLGVVKEFWIYTGLRIALFVASLGVVAGVWMLVSDEVPVLWVVVVAFAISGVASYYLLDRQRQAFARRVEARAARAAQAFEASKAKEDRD